MSMALVFPPALISDSRLNVYTVKGGTCGIKATTLCHEATIRALPDISLARADGENKTTRAEDGTYGSGFGCPAFLCRR